jgi:hypothetical protein
MTGRLRRGPVRGAFTQSGSSALAAMLAACASDEPRLDQLFAEPIVQQLMHRDRIDEAATRRLLQQVAAVRASPKLDFARSALWPGWILAVGVGLLLLIGLRGARDAAIRTPVDGQSR